MELPTAPDVATPPRQFVPPGFDPEQVPAIEEAVSRLLRRPITSPAHLASYLNDWSEVSSLVSGAHARRGSASHRETSNTAAKERLRRFQTEVWPAWENLQDSLNRRFLESPHRAGLPADLEVFVRNKETEARIFREENTRLAGEEQQRVTEWEGVQGATLVPFEGRDLTREQCVAILLDPDRARREGAFLALVRRRARDRARIDAIFDALLDLRGRSARNAGFDDYIGFRFAQLLRFDYTRQECVQFHAAVEEVVSPLASELRDVRRRRLGVPTLRPYDMNVSLLGRGAAPLFGDQPQLVGLARRLFRSVDPRFDAEFDILVRNGLLDLMSRPGKAPGGYNWGVEDIRLPFIFANAVGSPRDLQVLLHEGGHAFHTIASRELPLVDDRSSPTEFAEVASMGMELLAMEQMPAVFDPATARALEAENLEGIILSFGRIAQIDAFQHWIYEHPGHSPDERRAKWVELGLRFSPGLDWSGLLEYAADGWQAVPHFFAHPLYYIEYGIAQLGAIQLWRNYRRDPRAAVEAYRSALRLGGTRPLPELFRAAGLRFAMDASIFREVVPLAMERLRTLLAAG